MTWAEPMGLGEMGLMPSEFWSLLPREFYIKLDAFKRSEDRQEALMLQLVGRTAHLKDKDRNEVLKRANALKRYPVKRWLR